MDETAVGIRRMSPTFRSTLRQEVAVWVDEEVIEANQAAAISKRYGLDELAKGAGGLLTIVRDYDGHEHRKDEQPG